MPITRAMKAQNSNENHINTGVKRKADGRKILGELDNKNLATSSKNNLQSRKILTTRLNNKNVAAGSENLRNKRAGKDENTNSTHSNSNLKSDNLINLEKLTNTIKKGLSSISKNHSNQQCSSSSKEVCIADKPQKIEKKEPVLEKFNGHDQFTLLPMSVWREEIKADMIRSNTFFDYENSVKDSPNEAPEFSLGIFEYMKWREQRFEMKPYLDRTHPSCQTSFQVNDRRQLIDWMVEFQEIQESTHETLYLAVRLCDFYFSHKKVPREQLQLYAFVGFLLASKFEERWPPMFDDMIQLSDDQYTRDEFVVAEENMLKTLNFDINIPISYRYLRRYARCIGMDMKSMTVSRFYLELTLQEYEFVTESQSAMAAACLWIAMSTLGFDSVLRTRKEAILNGPTRYLKKYWSEQLTYYTGLHEWEVVPLAQRIAKVVRLTQHNLRNLQVSDESDEEDMILNNSLEQSANEQLCKVVYKKYASSVFFKVAQRPIIDDNSIEKHLRRANSERIDFEATLEPNSKRRSTGCTSKLQKMSLRSCTPNVPVRSVKRGVEEVKPFTDNPNESTKFFSAKSDRPAAIEDKENQI